MELVEPSCVYGQTIMTLVNTSIFDVSCSRTLLPRTIFQEQDGRTIVKELYDRVATASKQTLVREHIVGHHVHEVHIGQSKVCPSVSSSPDVLLSSVTSIFGRYVKFYIVKDAEPAPPPPAPTPCAISVLMASSAARSQSRPSPVVPERNKKDAMFNGIIGWMKKELSWCPAEVERGTAVNTIHTLRDALWAIDGHHHTLVELSCKITGYNKPELSKHQKG